MSDKESSHGLENSRIFATTIRVLSLLNFQKGRTDDTHHYDTDESPGRYDARLLDVVATLMVTKRQSIATSIRATNEATTIFCACNSAQNIEVAEVAYYDDFLRTLQKGGSLDQFSCSSLWLKPVVRRSSPDATSLRAK